MPVKNYVNVNGRTIAEHTGGVRTAYLTDALGSVTATVNSSQTVVNTYRWKPYGDRLAKTGAGADPTLGWVGTYGYRRTQRSRSEYYMLARHYDSIGGRWTTVDPQWPSQAPYNYAVSAPIVAMDPTGSVPWTWPAPWHEQPRPGILPPFGRIVPQDPPVRVHPPWTKSDPQDLPVDFHETPKPGQSVVVVAGRVLILVGGAIAVVDLIHFQCTGKTLTGMGEGAAQLLVPPPAPIPRGERTPDCDDELLATLTAEVDRQCKRPGLRYSCKTPFLLTKRDTKAIQAIIERNKRCLKARVTRDLRCFGGGDTGHIGQRDDVKNRIRGCLEIINGKK